MSEWVAILVAAGIGALQLLLAGVVSFLWSEMKSNRTECAQAARENKEDLKTTKADVMSEIIRLRDKVHDLTPAKESMDTLVKLLRDRR